jgi:predicted transcriptional regulator
VLLFLHGELDIGEYRPVKTDWVADQISMDRAHAGRALRLLAELGYILEGPRESHGVRQYRLAANVRIRAA